MQYQCIKINLPPHLIHRNKTFPAFRQHRVQDTSKHLTQWVFMTAFTLRERERDACWVREAARRSEKSHHDMCSYLINFQTELTDSCCRVRLLNAKIKLLTEPSSLLRGCFWCLDVKNDSSVFFILVFYICLLDHSSQPITTFRHHVNHYKQTSSDPSSVVTRLTVLKA